MKAVVFGAGKIARGFIGHLLALDRIPFVLVDVNEELVEQLNRRGSYTVHVMGNSDNNALIDRYTAISLSDPEAIAREWGEADLSFVSVGGKNLRRLAETMSQAFSIMCAKQKVTKPLNIIVCENWKDPAALLREEIRRSLAGSILEAFDRWVGIAEAVVMRSGVEPTLTMLVDDPLCVRVSDYWELPVDREALRGTPPEIGGIRYIDRFSGFLERKFFTYNAANATVSYLGYLRGHQEIYAAATDPQIRSVLEGVYKETSAALAQKHHISLEEQERFARQSLRKLQDPNIMDSVERNARDPIRKLGRDDRLVGAALLVQAQGGVPEHLATAIAAAMYYDNPDDPIALQFARMREANGIDAMLSEVCRLSAADPLRALVKEKVIELRNKGWIRDNKQRVVIIGAGKTGRGFLARVAASGQADVGFVDHDATLVDRLNADKAYTIHFFGGKRAPLRIEGVEAAVAGTDQAIEMLVRADLVFTAVGESNLSMIAPMLVQASRRRSENGGSEPMYVVTGENGAHPGSTLIDAASNADIPVAEAAIFCSTIEKPGSPLDILSESYDELPYDSTILPETMRLPLMKPEPYFHRLLQRKIYTYNCLSACIAYLGAFKGYVWYADAANDEEIRHVISYMFAPLNRAICAAFDIDPVEQEAFASAAIRKFGDPHIRDDIARNARDVLRKLGPEERIIAPYRLVQTLEEDISPFALTAAAALLYRGPNESERITRLRPAEVRGILMEISRLGSDDALFLDKAERYWTLLSKTQSGNIGLYDLLRI